MILSPMIGNCPGISFRSVCEPFQYLFGIFHFKLVFNFICLYTTLFVCIQLYLSNTSNSSKSFFINVLETVTRFLCRQRGQLFGVKNSFFGSH